MVIYPLDSAIHPFNNWAQVCKLRFQSLGPWEALSVWCEGLGLRLWCLPTDGGIWTGCDPYIQGNLVFKCNVAKLATKGAGSSVFVSSRTDLFQAPS